VTGIRTGDDIRVDEKVGRHSGFPSKRINLSPFTKDFRGGEQFK
jgi:hypothetical protein